MTIKSVTIAELKNRLSHYLRLARRGESILVRDRDHVVARIEAAGGGTTADRLASLEMRGILRRGRGRLPGDLHVRRVRTRADAVGALLRDREGSR